ncbi:MULTISPECIES: diguanylate cyclase domain-containing protein [unclassified Treponema]|uniref:diguanylate cyclase domain-containing protein n=1 Tax=unclassified Treponema TaxID=2638727 RepID=UPI0020A54CB8|nr:MULTISPECIES: diguanylate cyclase [unclassified Treponema]UTC68166.1 diguanylate cyclase [Treponema sp. OMZ 789]UTC70886.1 diguanylate cyclase [Treponema sp. OMZ 790]UTC73626.1 diguanylate cyclase [Treponema sp. OMZ 791]
MKKMYIGIYAAIALIIIFGTFSWFVYGIIKDSDYGAEESRSIFAYFAKQIIISSEKDNFAQTSYNQKLYELANELEIKAFVISKPSKNVVVSWPKDSDLIGYDEAGNFIIKPASLFVVNHTGKINVKTMQSYDTELVLTASIPTLKPAAIYLRLRSAFFIILAVTILTIIIILVTNLTNTQEMVYADIKQGGFGDGELEDEVYPNIDYNEPEQNFQDNSGISENIGNHKTIHETADDDVYGLEDLDNLKITQQFPYESGAGTTYKEEKDIAYISSDSEEYTDIQNTSVFDTANAEAIEKVRGLYSPITGISWQEYLPEYLESELRRAASSEQDIALVIMKLDDFSLESMIGKKIAALLIDFIKFRDMIFEFDSNGFAAILQDTNLDEAMKKAEEIYKGTKSILTEYDISKSVSIGITTRTSRLISSGRMIEEAQAAVNRAINNNDDPIVAFRVNPDKYREFISDN